MKRRKDVDEYLLNMKHKLDVMDIALKISDEYSGNLENASTSSIIFLMFPEMEGDLMFEMMIDQRKRAHKEVKNR